MGSRLLFAYLQVNSVPTQPPTENLVDALLSNSLSLPSSPVAEGSVVPSPSFSMYMLSRISSAEASKLFVSSFLSTRCVSTARMFVPSFSSSFSTDSPTTTAVAMTFSFVAAVLLSIAPSGMLILRISTPFRYTTAPAFTITVISAEAKSAREGISNTFT